MIFIFAETQLMLFIDNLVMQKLTTVFISIVIKPLMNFKTNDTTQYLFNR